MKRISGILEFRANRDTNHFPDEPVVSEVVEFLSRNRFNEIEQSKHDLERNGAYTQYSSVSVAKELGFDRWYYVGPCDPSSISTFWIRFGIGKTSFFLRVYPSKTREYRMYTLNSNGVKKVKTYRTGKEFAEDVDAIISRSN